MQTPDSLPKPKRPWSVTWLTLGVLTFTGMHISRLVQSIVFWEILKDRLTFLSPAYLAITGLFWGLVGLPIIYGLFTGKPWASRALLFASLGYAGYYWADRLSLAGSPFKTTNQFFAIGATTTILLLIQWIRTRPKVQAFFGETND
ncbi:MAG: hypothetical protein OEZ02_02230 [Anaerolineae bacterium]|nr:hypothetical protein [Anaerolineae bacterium]